MHKRRLIREHRLATLVVVPLRPTFALQLVMLFSFGLPNASKHGISGSGRCPHLLLQMLLDLASGGGARVENLREWVTRDA